MRTASFRHQFTSKQVNCFKIDGKTYFLLFGKENGLKLDIKYPGTAYVAWIKLAYCWSSGGSFDPCNATLGSIESVQYPDDLNVRIQR
jgi:hypothetical protein